MKWSFESGKRYIFSSPVSIEDYVRAEMMSNDQAQAQSRSYTDEYEWFVNTCEEFDIEPECFDD